MVQTSSKGMRSQYEGSATYQHSVPSPSKYPLGGASDDPLDQRPKIGEFNRQDLNPAHFPRRASLLHL